MHKSALITLLSGSIVFDFQATCVHRIRDHTLTKQALSSFIERFAMPQEIPHHWYAQLEWKFAATINSDLHKMFPRNRADKWRCANLQKRKEGVSLILFRDVPHSVP
jgi:hypothetical protein